VALLELILAILGVVGIATCWLAFSALR